MLKGLKLRQIAFSDMVILNKVDLAGPGELEQVRTWLTGTFDRLRIVETERCEVPLEILMAVGRFEPIQKSLDEGCSDPDCSLDHHEQSLEDVQHLEL
jgi:G3E family GTPase